MEKVAHSRTSAAPGACRLKVRAPVRQRLLCIAKLQRGLICDTVYVLCPDGWAATSVAAPEGVLRSRKGPIGPSPSDRFSAEPPLGHHVGDRDPGDPLRTLGFAFGFVHRMKGVRAIGPIFTISGRLEMWVWSIRDDGAPGRPGVAMGRRNTDP